MAVAAGVLPERYTDPRLIGHGGMGEIYLARDRQLERQVAIKVLAERFARDEALRERFTREAMTAARLSGEPHIATIFDVGEWNERPYIVMEYLAGGTLAERARERPVERVQALTWLDQAGAALDAAHRRGVVHRDVKPANLLFDERGDLHVADFGVARLLDETTGNLTAAGTVLGTAGYISPEQARGERATEASDLYSLAVVAYELLTGGRPFARGSATAEALAHVNEPVPPASERGVGLPARVDQVFGRALAKHPAERYRSARELLAELRKALAGPEHERTRVLPTVPPRRRESRPTLPLLVAALLLALIGGGVIAALTTRGEDERPPAQPERITITRERTLEGTTIVQTQTTTVPAEPAPGTPPGELSPEDAAALNDEAFTEHMEQGDYAGALPLLERAAPALRGTYSSDFPYEAYVEYNLGKTLAELGRCDEALPHLERSEDLQGSKAPITAAKRQCGA